MLCIRPEQMQALSKHMLESFKQRLAAHLRRKFDVAPVDMDDATLDVAISATMERAQSYGVRSENDIRRFAECQFTLGPHFDTDPSIAWAGETLQRPDLSGTAKMDQIEARQRAAAPDPTEQDRRTTTRVRQEVW